MNSVRRLSTRAFPSRSARGFGADASGSVWEVGLVTMPAFVAQAHGSTVRPLFALVMEPAIANALHDPQAPLPPRSPRTSAWPPAPPTTTPRKCAASGAELLRGGLGLERLGLLADLELAGVEAPEPLPTPLGWTAQLLNDAVPCKHIASSPPNRCRPIHWTDGFEAR